MRYPQLWEVSELHLMSFCYSCGRHLADEFADADEVDPADESLCRSAHKRGYHEHCACDGAWIDWKIHQTASHRFRTAKAFLLYACACAWLKSELAFGIEPGVDIFTKSTLLLETRFTPRMFALPWFLS